MLKSQFPKLFSEKALPGLQKRKPTQVRGKSAKQLQIAKVKGRSQPRSPKRG